MEAKCSFERSESLQLPVVVVADLEKAPVFDYYPESQGFSSLPGCLSKAVFCEENKWKRTTCFEYE